MMSKLKQEFVLGYRQGWEIFWWPFTGFHVEFSKDPVVRDISYRWNVNIAYGASSIAAITILDAKANGYWPLENAAELLRSAA